MRACNMVSGQLSLDIDASIVSDWKNSLSSYAASVPRLMTATEFPFGNLLYDCWLNRPFAYRGERVGEAKNPGPPKSNPDIFQISVVNPTSVYDKAKQITDTGHLVLMSETSATDKIQTIERSKFLSHGHHVIWGDPVPSMKQVAHNEFLRGISGGVAASSSFPIRETRDIWKATTRILETYLHLQHFDIRVFVIYGMPQGSSRSNSHGFTATNYLLEMCYQRMRLNNVPTIIGGDIHRKVQSLPAWKKLESIGFCELHEYWHKRNGQWLPPTCTAVKEENTEKGTRNDTLLIDPRLVCYLRNARTLLDRSFHRHRPLQVDFAFPKNQLFRQRWKLPRDFTDLCPDPERISNHYKLETPAPEQGDPDIDNEQLIQTWAHSVECAAHRAIQDQHSTDPTKQPNIGLPCGYRGRCKPRKLIRVPLAQPVKAGRHNDYQPPAEALTIKSKQKVRQIRRLRSLYARIAEADGTAKEIPVEAGVESNPPCARVRQFLYALDTPMAGGTIHPM